MAEHRISWRKRRSLKPNVIPTTYSASNVRRTPKSKTKSRQTTAISKTKSKRTAAVTLEKWVRDKTLCKDIRKLSTQYQTSSVEPSRASIAFLPMKNSARALPKTTRTVEEPGSFRTPVFLKVSYAPLPLQWRRIASRIVIGCHLTP
ncbi:hypothetical protein LSAT2_024823 [Lamellibrachia satsuma]|nr:hypothetical protein LSAT2_024823 [Lamellibrachia satsuma]